MTAENACRVLYVKILRYKKDSKTGNDFDIDTYQLHFKSNFT